MVSGVSLESLQEHRMKHILALLLAKVTPVIILKRQPCNCAAWQKVYMPHFYKAGIC